MNFRYMEQMETLGKVVKKGSMLSPQAHHRTYVLVVVFKLGKKFLIDVFALVFGKDYVF